MAGNMYDGVKPINEMGGECKHKCLYCSTKLFCHTYHASKVKYSGDYRIFEKELKKNLKGNQIIFECGQNDLFEESVPTKIIEKILKRSRERDQSNLYMFQTKNPKRFKDFIDQLPTNYMLGTTIETNRESTISELSDAPSIESRVDAMVFLSDHPRYVTIEPIFDFDLDEFIEIIKRINPDKVFIGADSKVHKYPKIYNNLKLPEPNAEKIVKLMEALEKFTRLEQKTNLIRLLKGSGTNEKGIGN